MDIKMDPACKGCAYLGYAGGGYMCCDYIFKEDRRRPCPPGKDCTVKITARELKRQQKPKVRGTLRRCQWCGEEFVLKNNATQKFCCRTCKDAAYRDQCRKRREEARAEAITAGRSKEQEEVCGGGQEKDGAR